MWRELGGLEVDGGLSEEGFFFIINPRFIPTVNPPVHNTMSSQIPPYTTLFKLDIENVIKK